MCTIDYVSVTYKVLYVEQVVAIYGVVWPNLVATHGHHGYKQCFRGDGIAIYHDGMPGMGVHVQLSGQGCALLASSDGWQGWGVWFSDVLDCDTQFTRIDFAYDDKAGLITMDRLRELQAEGAFVSRWQEMSVRLKKRGLAIVEDRIYYGRADGETGLCIYDKRLERLAHGEVDPGAWVRFELRFKSGRAMAAAKWIVLHPDLDGAEGLLAQVCDFRIPDGGANISRRRSYAWWKEFLCNAAKVRLQAVRVIKGLTEKVRHFVLQHSASHEVLRAAWQKCGLAGSFEQEFQEAGAGRLRERHKEEIARLVKQWRTEKGLAVTT